MKAARGGLVWHRAVTTLLGTVLFGVALALAFLLMCLAGPASQAAPAVPTLLSPVHGLWINQRDVRFVWSDVGAPTYNLRVDKVVYTTTATSIVLSLLDGPHTWAAQALSGTVASGYSDEWTVNIDTTPPPVPELISPAPNAFTNQSNVEFRWEDVGALTTYDLYVDEVTHATDSTSMVLPLTDGPHQWTVRAIDALGNASAYAPQRMVTVDRVRPVVSLGAPQNGAVLTTTHLLAVTISGTASDATALDRVEVNTGTMWNRASGTTNWTYAWALPRLDNQPVTLRARSFDKADNESIWSQVPVTVDTVAPTCGAPVPDRSPWVTSTVVYTWAPATDGSGIGRYQVHIYSTGGYSAFFDTTNTRYVFTQATQQSKAYYARVRAVDGRGNWGAWSEPSAVVLPDLTPPTISDPFILTSGAHLYAVGTQLYYSNTMSPWLGETFTVLGYSTDSGSGVEWVCFSPAFGKQPSCDTAGFWPWQSSNPHYTVNSGTTESGEIVATVYDQVDNAVQQIYFYELDGTPPGSTASAPPYVTTPPIRVSWVAADAQSGVHSVELWYRHGSSGAWRKWWDTRLAGEGPFEFVPSDGPGTYSFVTVARDNLGNLERRATVADAQTVYNTGKPASEVTWAPAYWNKPGTPITVTWVATPSLAPLSEVRLWYSFNQDGWQETTIASTGAVTSGVFAFLPDVNGKYHFGTVARDVSGQLEAEPYGTGNRTTVYDTEIGTPTGLTCDPAGWSRKNSFTVSWTNPDDLSGIAAARYKVGSAPSGPLDGTRVMGKNLKQMEGITLPSEGQHTVWVWLEDQAGNIDHTCAAMTACRYDASVGAPSGLASIPSGWTSADGFTVTWTNPPDLSGIAGAYWKLDNLPRGPQDGNPAPGLDRDWISGVKVGSEGRHTLYVWLQDGVGNNGFDLGNWRTVDLLYDPTPPTDVSITAPESAPKVSFVVRWSANAAASGLLHYTVQYSGGMTSTWQSWLPSTTETSGLFTAPVADTEYDLRITAYDRAGNKAWAQTQVTVERQRMYLPVIENHYRWRPWHRYDEYEPNDYPSEAKGPLVSGQTYQSYIWNAEDIDDYFYLIPMSPQPVVITLTNIPKSCKEQGAPRECDYDLHVYEEGLVWKDGELVEGYVRLVGSDRPGQANERLEFVPQAGRTYWVRVYPYDRENGKWGYSSTQPYHLTATYK